jgi:3',5'-cyclic AMP phosphodiesterase CpdA
MADQTWEYRSFDATQGPQPVVDYLNEPQRQDRGQAFAVVVYPASVGLFFVAPGIVLGGYQMWMFRSFTADQGPQGAADFLNEFPRQGDGEAFAIAGNDGSIGLFYLDPGSGGDNPDRTLPPWMFRSFSADDGLLGALDFLNEDPRQWPGQAFAVAGNDGTVGLFFHDAPVDFGWTGSWGVKSFTADEGTQGALDFLNQILHAPYPSGFARNDGTVGLLYAASW